MTKITLLSTFFPLRGGIAQFNAALFRELEKNNDIEAVNFKRQYPNILFPGKTQYVTAEDKNADPIPSKQYLDSINPLNWLKTAKYIKKTKPKLLLVRFWLPFFGPCLGFISAFLKKNTRSIAILDNVIPHEKRFFDMPFLRYFLKRFDAFVLMSEQVKKDLLSIKPDAKYVFSPHPIYSHFGEQIDKKTAREKLNLDSKKNTLLFFGFIRDYKGLDLLIEAFSHLSEDYQLVIAGESYGSFEKYKKQIAENKNKERIVTHIRYISDDEVPLFFCSADVCILPYKSATQSGITSIAYHFELPLIATDVGGLKEMVIDNLTGKIIDTANAKNIEMGIKDFFSNNQSLNFIENIKKEKEKLSWKTFADNLLKLYSEIA